MSRGISLTETALIIPGHGSTENRQSSKATRDLADEIRERGIFAEVHAAFWKEEPHYREALGLVSCSEIFVVPHFISEGYFTQEVIPREFKLDGKLTQRDGLCIRYCDPVGCHPGMTELLLSRTREVAIGVDPAEISLLVLGHGTECKSLLQVRRLRQRTGRLGQRIRGLGQRIRRGRRRAVSGFGQCVGRCFDCPDGARKTGAGLQRLDRLTE